MIRAGLSHFDAVPAAQIDAYPASAAFIGVYLHTGAQRFLLVRHPADRARRAFPQGLADAVVRRAFLFVNIRFHFIIL
jgi:hypothetical protein